MKDFYYRFKTEEEMLKEFGTYWRNESQFNSEEYMDYLLGTKLEVDFPDNETIVDIPNKDRRSLHAFNRWTINRKMVVKVDNRPNYSPRRIDRTLESVSSREDIKSILDKSPYDIIVYRVDSIRDYSDFANVMEKYPFFVLYDRQSDSDYYIALKGNGTWHQFSIYQASHHTYYDTGRHIDDYPNLKFYPRRIDDPKELDRVLHSLTTRTPNYTPRRIDRTLERSSLVEAVSIPYYNPITKEETRYPYRFFTEDEFDEHYGDDWLDEIDWNYEGMNYLFGTTFKSFEKEGSDGHWSIYREMLTDNDKNKPKVPNYRPRKIDRTLESIGDKYFNLVKGKPTKYPYRFKTEKEFTKEYGWSWRSNLGNPNWADGMDNLSGQDYKYDLSELNTQFDIPRRDRYIDTNGEDWAISWKMLTKNQEVPQVPNYAPRKIDRTLESVSKTLYRFKTKDEFVKEYGKDWQNIIGCGWCSPHMDGLFGVDYPCDDLTRMTNVNFAGYNWNISRDMITKKTIVPSYNPRKIDRTL